MAINNMASPLAQLPDELLEAIITHLPPQATLAFGLTSKRHSKVTHDALVWRRHCVRTWRYWESHYNFEELLDLPPARTRWRKLFNERRAIDTHAKRIFEELLRDQQSRYARMEEIASCGYNVKDLLTSLRDETSDEAEDCLARRWHAAAILSQIHRKTAVEKWLRLQRRQMVALEEVLGAYDLFVLAGKKGDLTDISKELDRLAEAIQSRDDEWEERSVRFKAVQIAKFLRSKELVGNPDPLDYHALRNNFVSLALFESPHTSLPLQSVAIYCAVARRLGVNAKPSNYPHHVHAVIEAPAEQTLDGKPRGPLPAGEEAEAEHEMMHLDPWRSSDEVPRSQLTLRLQQMGAPPAQHAHHLGPTSNLEICLRTGRNIMNSVQEARDRQRGLSHRPSSPDIESAWYSMLWSMLILGDSSPATTLHRRRQVMPYLVEHFQAHFPEDFTLIESVIVPMFESEREHHALLDMVSRLRIADGTKNAPKPRDNATKEGIKFKVGQTFRHKRYAYKGFIVGWDVKCSQEDAWIQQMRVDDLPRGRHQPFYNIMHDIPSVRCSSVFLLTVHSADDKSQRYVAEENIEVLDTEPSEALMQLAGKYFKRWDDEQKVFISNIKDEYPDD